MRHELTGEIPRVNLVVNSNLCLEQPALSGPDSTTSISCRLVRQQVVQQVVQHLDVSKCCGFCCRLSFFCAPVMYTSGCGLVVQLVVTHVVQHNIRNEQK